MYMCIFVCVCMCACVGEFVYKFVFTYVCVYHITLQVTPRYFHLQEQLNKEISRSGNSLQETQWVRCGQQSPEYHHRRFNKDSGSTEPGGAVAVRENKRRKYM